MEYDEQDMTGHYAWWVSGSLTVRVTRIGTGKDVPLGKVPNYVLAAILKAIVTDETYSDPEVDQVRIEGLRGENSG
jgi:hypothetical protein